jgi:hypothetical protein
VLKGTLVLCCKVGGIYMAIEIEERLSGMVLSLCQNMLRCYEPYERLQTQCEAATYNYQYEEFKKEIREAMAKIDPSISRDGKTALYQRYVVMCIKLICRSSNNGLSCCQGNMSG